MDQQPAAPGHGHDLSLPLSLPFRAPPDTACSPAPLPPPVCRGPDDTRRTTQQPPRQPRWKRQTDRQGTGHGPCLCQPRAIKRQAIRLQPRRTFALSRALSAARRGAAFRLHSSIIITLCNGNGGDRRRRRQRRHPLYCDTKASVPRSLQAPGGAEGVAQEATAPMKPRALACARSHVCVPGPRGQDVDQHSQGPRTGPTGQSGGNEGPVRPGSLNPFPACQRTTPSRSPSEMPSRIPSCGAPRKVGRALPARV